MPTTTERRTPTGDEIEAAATALAQASELVEEIMLAIRPDTPDVYPLEPGLPDAELAMRLVLFAENTLDMEVQVLRDSQRCIVEWAEGRYWTHLSGADA